MEIILEMLIEKVISFALNRKRSLSFRLFIFFLFWIPFLTLEVLLILDHELISGWPVTFLIFLASLGLVFYFFDLILTNESPSR